VTAAGPQLAMVVDDPAEIQREKEREVEAQQEIFAAFFKAVREVCREHGYEFCANALDAVWAPLGRGVSASTLKMTLAPGNERNYFRFEWAIWFARQSDDVAEVLAEIIGAARPQKKPEDELRDLQDIVRSEYPRQAEKIIRRAATPKTGGRR
jgi:hypothetical protein